MQDAYATEDSSVVFQFDFDPVSTLLAHRVHTYKLPLKFVCGVPLSSNTYTEAIEMTHLDSSICKDDAEHSVEVQRFGSLIDLYRDMKNQDIHLTQQYTTLFQAIEIRPKLDTVQSVMFSQLADENLNELLASINKRPSSIEILPHGPTLKQYRDELKLYISKRYILGFCESYVQKFDEALKEARKRLDLCNSILQKYDLYSKSYTVRANIANHVEYNEFLRILCDRMQKFECGSISEDVFINNIVELAIEEFEALQRMCIILHMYAKNRMSGVIKILNSYYPYDRYNFAEIIPVLVRICLILRSTFEKKHYLTRVGYRLYEINLEDAMNYFYTICDNIRHEAETAFSQFIHQRTTIKNFIRQCCSQDLSEILSSIVLGLRWVNGKIAIIRNTILDSDAYDFMRIFKHVHEQGLKLHF